MDQELDLSILAEQQPDPEVFRRVWRRVMPDQEASPIVVTPPTPRKTAPAPTPAHTAPAAPKASAPTPSAKPKTEAAAYPAKPSHSDTQALKNLMDQAQAAFSSAQMLARRGGRNSRTLSAMAADHRRALRQLSAAYFLMTGQRYRPNTQPPAMPASLPLGLRDHFVRAQRWESACWQAGNSTSDRHLRKLCEELARDGVVHTGLIRSMLEQM